VGVLTDIALEESRHQLRSEHGVETSYLRLRALPFTKDVKAFVEAHERVYVVEQNRDGQMGDLLRLEVGDIQHKLRKILHYTGLPCDARSITDSLLQMENDGTRIVRIGLGAEAATQTIGED